MARTQHSIPASSLKVSEHNLLRFYKSIKNYLTRSDYENNLISIAQIDEEPNFVAVLTFAVVDDVAGARGFSHFVEFILVDRASVSGCRRNRVSYSIASENKRVIDYFFWR